MSGIPFRMNSLNTHAESNIFPLLPGGSDQNPVVNAPTNAMINATIDAIIDAIMNAIIDALMESAMMGLIARDETEVASLSWARAVRSREVQHYLMIETHTHMVRS